MTLITWILAADSVACICLLAFCVYQAVTWRRYVKNLHRELDREIGAAFAYRNDMGPHV